MTHLTNVNKIHIVKRMAKVLLEGYRCERCEHEWLPRDKNEEPRVCPKCKSPYWNRPRRAAKQAVIDAVFSRNAEGEAYGG